MGQLGIVSLVPKVLVRDSLVLTRQVLIGEVLKDFLIVFDYVVKSWLATGRERSIELITFILPIENALVA